MIHRSQSITPEEIKKAYRVVAMQCHPDKGAAGLVAEFLILKKMSERCSGRRRVFPDRSMFYGTPKMATYPFGAFLQNHTKEGGYQLKQEEPPRRSICQGLSKVSMSLLGLAGIQPLAFGSK